MHPNNLWNPIEFQSDRPKIKATWGVCLHNTSATCTQFNPDFNSTIFNPECNSRLKGVLMSKNDTPSETTSHRVSSLADCPCLDCHQTNSEPATHSSSTSNLVTKISLSITNGRQYTSFGRNNSSAKLVLPISGWTCNISSALDYYWTVTTVTAWYGS